MHHNLLESDYISDFVRWTKICSSIKNRDLSKLESIQTDIINSNDPALAYHFANDINYQNYKMQNVILKSKSPKYAILFAKYIENADINALQNMILESKDIKYICKFGCFIPNANLKKIESIILTKKNAKYAHMFIKHVKGINLNKLKKIIFEAKKPRYLYELAKHLKSKKDLQLIQQLIIESKSPTYIRMFAEKFKFSDIEKLEQAILDLNDIKEIKKFALYVKRSKMKNFIILF